MRFIGSVKSEEELSKLSSLLHKEGVEYSYELQLKAGSKEPYFDIWIVEEDKVEIAEKIFKAALHSKHAGSIASNSKAEEKKSRTIFEMPPISDKSNTRPQARLQVKTLTNLFIGICIFFFIMQQVQLMQVTSRQKHLDQNLKVMTPLMNWMLYDFPQVFRLTQEFEERFQSPPYLYKKDMSPEERTLKRKIKQSFWWRGIYPLLSDYLQGYPNYLQNYPGYPVKSEWEVDKFEDISRGQIWRIFTPTFLHSSFSHLFFNMFWIFILGAPIEKRIGKIKYLLAIMIVAAISNTVQYLMTGPLFLGYSGVICFYAGFIFSRKKKAPWEGYSIQSVVLWFLFSYVFALFSLSAFNLLLFVLNHNFKYYIFFDVGNSSHIAGLLTGLLLGKTNLFAWSAK